MSFKMGGIPAGSKRGWEVSINGVSSLVSSVFLHSDKYGTVCYGLRPEGYDSWTFAMQDSSVVLPYTKNPDGEVFIGLIKENRANLGGEYWCALGGFADPGESFKDAAVRETAEESGMDAQTCVQLPGYPVVEDRLLFVADPNTGEGCNVNYGFLIPFEELKEDEDGNYRLINNPTDHKKADQVVFFPWKEAVKVTPDGIALAAISQLLVVVL